MRRLLLWFGPDRRANARRGPGTRRQKNRTFVCTCPFIHDEPDEVVSHCALPQVRACYCIPSAVSSQGGLRLLWRYGLRLATILLPNWDEGQRADTTTGPRMRFRPENIDQTARDRIRLGGMAKPVWAIHARSRVQGTILS